MSSTILITGAGSGFGAGTALGLAKTGYGVIATARSQAAAEAVAAKAKAAGYSLAAHKLDVTKSADVDEILSLDFDILVNNAAQGEGGPISEIPIDILKSVFETNVFGPLTLTQRVVKKWIDAKTNGKVIFVSSVAGLEFPPVIAPYASSKHALEMVARGLYRELKQFGIQVQMINPGPFLTGFNEKMVENAFRWLDDKKNFTTHAMMRAEADAFIDQETWKVDPATMIERMIQIVPARTGRYRNIYPEKMRELVDLRAAETFDLEI
jgi:NAD(P)-dependent dehydrogenase (short-subunit alcohol dehydrogenase family)